MDSLTLVLAAFVVLQALQTAQLVILRRDVKRTLYPPPMKAPMKEYEKAPCLYCGR